MTADPDAAAASQDDKSLVGGSFTLVMQLEDPRRLAELLTWIAEHRTRIDLALRQLDYVHYSRFVPIIDAGRLLIVTDFDGRKKDYVMDFAAVLADEFSKILSYMKDKPRLPVNEYPEDFYDYVERNSSMPEQKGKSSQFRAYNESVLDINGIDRAKDPTVLLEQPTLSPSDVDRLNANVQANVLRGYFTRRADKAAYAVHVGVSFNDATPEQARAFVHDLLHKDPDLGVTFADRWKTAKEKAKPKTAEDRKSGGYGPGDGNGGNGNGIGNGDGKNSGDEGGSDKPPYCLNAGFTHEGLKRLGVPSLALSVFSTAFREGPALREITAEIDPNGQPMGWELDPARDGVHAFLSLYSEDKGELTARLEALKRLAAGRAAKIVYERKAESFDANAARIHFGYVDSISQPRIKGLSIDVPDGDQTPALAGDFILGGKLTNSRRGNFIGQLPPVLADYGTYAAVRVIRQFQSEFDQVLARVADKSQLTPTQVAAQLMGRELDGRPLSRAAAQAARTTGESGDKHFNDFLYAYPKASTAREADDLDDSAGTQCPLGAHIRRMNPRNAAVTGIPSLRRVIRRGLPYGPAYDAKTEQNAEKDRGLFGVFLCGDLESQYEFLLRVWANGDIATSGIRGTVDPFVGARKDERKFNLRVPADGKCPAGAKTVEKSIAWTEPLTRTLGAAYLFMPGLPGLEWIATAGWESRTQSGHAGDSTVGQSAGTATPTAAAAATPAARPPSATPYGVAKPLASTAAEFSPVDPAFRIDPYRFYAQARAKSPGIAWLPTHSAWWVFSHELVDKYSADQECFRKPDRKSKPGRRVDRDGEVPAAAKSTALDIVDHFEDGLFYMPKARHDEVSPALKEVFATAIRRAEDFAQADANRLLSEPLRRGRLDVVSEYAAPLTMHVFMDMMGLPREHWAGVDGWVRSALAGHDIAIDPRVRFDGGTSTMALRAYFQGLGLGGVEAATAAGDVPLMCGIRALTDAPWGTATKCPFDAAEAPQAKPPLTLTEAIQTALHFALGGYLSTEFLITTGVFNLLSHPEQLKTLSPKCGSEQLERAIQEMLRYDAPFQMADRVVTEDVDAGDGVRLKKGQSVTLIYGSANHDPKLVDKPDVFDISREPVRHFGFGPPSRYCIGQQLALTVARVALRTLLESFPFGNTPRMQAGDWLADPYYRSLKSLQVLAE